jgi:hypothetical protein
MLQAADDSIVDRSLTGSIVVEYLCDEHRQGFGGRIATFAMRRQMSLERVEEALVGDQIEHTSRIKCGT